MNFKNVEIFELQLLKTKKTEIRLYLKPATKWEKEKEREEEREGEEREREKES